jgi:hypothetical protein
VDICPPLLFKGKTDVIDVRIITNTHSKPLDGLTYAKIAMPEKAKNKSYFWNMGAHNYGINLSNLTLMEYASFSASFKEYCEAVLFMLRVKAHFIFEDELLEQYKDDDAVQSHIAVGAQGMDAVRGAMPDRFISAGKRKKDGENEFRPAWFDLWEENYFITPEFPRYDLFFAYQLRQTDLLELDNVLNYFFENSTNNSVKDFTRFLTLTLRKHGKKLLQPEQIETVNEWIEAQEKEANLSGTDHTKNKGKVKRDRDDKLTLLNQEQIVILIYCLRKTNVILTDELLNNKDAGQAFSILTGYSADTIRQNLNKSELAKTATAKNVGVVEMALREVLEYIEKEVKPE